MPNQRLDQYLASQYPEISRGYIQKLIADGQILVNKKPGKPGYKLKNDDKLKILIDLSKIGQVEDIDLPIIYEDENVLVINKPVGVLSHALSKFHSEPSVASFLRQKLGKKDSDIRFGIVHRLDRATSGVMICAKNEQTMRYLQKQFSNRQVEKSYIAVIQGVIEPKESLIDVPLERNPKSPARFRAGANGKTAQTFYKVIQAGKRYSLVELKPKTGRTHQLRVHLNYLKHPIFGDNLYDGQEADRLYLHAWKISIDIPDLGSKTFEAPLPKEFDKLVNTP